jgi:hypothetical protein
MSIYSEDIDNMKVVTENKLIKGNPNTTPICPDRKLGEIERLVEEINIEMEMLEKAIFGLESKINPVLIPGKEVQDDNKKQPIEAESSLGRALFELRQKLIGKKYFIEYISRRVTL